MTDPTGRPSRDDAASTDGDGFAPPGEQPTAPIAPAPTTPEPPRPAPPHLAPDAGSPDVQPTVAIPWGTPIAGAPLPATAGTAVVALVCAILSWIAIPVVLAIVALVLARSAEREIQSSNGLKTGEGLVRAAQWIAWIHLLVVAMIIAFTAAFIVAVAVAR